jgi:hypothetical protein
MKTLLEEIETVVATVVPHPAAAPPARVEVQAAMRPIVKTKPDSYPSCLDLAAEFIARG